MRFERSGALVLILVAGVNAASLENAESAYRKTDYTAAIRELGSVPQGAAYWDLTGRCRFQLGEYKSAIEAFEKAAKLEPGNSRYMNWLGKSYGRQAETGGMLSAPSNASKARQAFERAVQLDPKNGEAAGDLFTYYLEAPGFLGGGVEKAQALAKQTASRDPAESEWMLAEIAKKNKQRDAAEKHLKAAADLDGKSPGRWLDLGAFYFENTRYSEGEKAFEQADRVAPGSAKVAFARAKAYVRSGRNLEGARKLLERYLKMALTPDDASRREANELLKKIGG
jgi:cytochrome c-type biogenesis protein CcmH/NrfG